MNKLYDIYNGFSGRLLSRINS